jgi:nicotinic acid mononucleotide adenylyltransferase
MDDYIQKDKKKNKRKFKPLFDPKKYINVKPVMNESNKKAIVFSFGRLNPITIGHEKLVNKIIYEAAKRKADAALYLSHLHDKNKNPLSYDQKIYYASKAFGKIVKKSPARTIIEVAKELNKKYNEIILVVGSDRAKEFELLLNKYNGKEYNFDNIEIISIEERNSNNGDSVSNMSASKLRNLAAQGNLEEFKKGLPKKLQSLAKEIYDDIRKGMGITEDFMTEEDLAEKAPLTIAQRRKRALLMKRIKTKLKIAREKAKKRMASKDKLELRSRRKALQIIRNRLSKKPYNELSPSEKIELDKRLLRIPQSVIDRIAKKQLPIVRKAEMERLQRILNPNDMKNEAFENFYENYSQLKNKLNYFIKRYHHGLTKDGKINFDKRFKIFRKNAYDSFLQKNDKNLNLLEEILDLKKSVSEYLNEVLKKEKDDPCWDGYVKLGMKKKGNKKVPNCVPIKNESFDTSQENDNRKSIYKRLINSIKTKNISRKKEIDKSDPSNREEGTDSLVKILKKDTPGQNLKEYTLNPHISIGDRVSFKYNTITGVSKIIRGTVVGTQTYAHYDESDPMIKRSLRIRDDSGKLYFVNPKDVDVIE